MEGGLGVYIKFSFRNIGNISTWKTEALKGGGDFGSENPLDFRGVSGE